MENSMKKCIFLLFLALFISVSIFSQEGTDKDTNPKTEEEINDEQANIVRIDSLDNLNKNYFIKPGSDGNSILIQRLSWEKVEDIKAYNFILEKTDKNGLWQNILEEKLKNNYKDVTLAPGKYRYKVATVNVLGQIEIYSDYRNFEIKVAHQPKLKAIVPDTIYFDDVFSDEILIKGKEIMPNAVFLLQSKKDKEKKIYGKATYVSEEGDKATIKFNMRAVNPEDYNFVVIDTSSLKDESQTMSFKFKKPVDIYLSGGYAFTGFAANPVFKQYLNNSVSPLGGLSRLTLMVYKRSYGAFGLNLTASGSSLKARENKDVTYKMNSGFFISQLNFASVFPIKRRLINFDFHLGFSALIITNVQVKFDDTENGKSKEVWALNLGLSGGTAFQFYVYKKLYVELNLDHIWTFPANKKASATPTPTDNDEKQHGLAFGFPRYIYQPSISIGWEF